MSTCSDTETATVLRITDPGSLGLMTSMVFVFRTSQNSYVARSVVMRYSSMFARVAGPTLRAALAETISRYCSPSVASLMHRAIGTAA